MSYCECCGNLIVGQICELCGFIEPTYSDEESARNNPLEASIAEYKRSPEYRKAVLSNTKFSVKSTVIQFNEMTGQYEQKGLVDLFNPGLVGTDFYDQPVFSTQWIAHSDGPADINVEYIFGGVHKTISAQVRFEPREGLIWYLGLHINSSLQLEVLLGSRPVGEKHVTESEKLCTVNIDFHV